LISREGLDRDGRVTLGPVSDNSKRVHHHAFEDRNGDWNILIRDQNDKNIAAYVLNKQTGGWTQRSLTNAEQNR
jgi:hypothetical protein